ncbi:hypothetical protein [Xanthobacter tagetidis]|uniref:Uncharacterized protein n=2 Tax=Xanthobacter tagetidis TaxID=60216 RepID=A0A3L7AFM7_9HYPH|nr:hypothetical protein D9R14_11965 [Xanthobacter tagetidis]
MIFTKNVDRLIVGSDQRWLLFMATPDGLRQAGGIFPSPRAALAAVDTRLRQHGGVFRGRATARRALRSASR